MAQTVLGLGYQYFQLQSPPKKNTNSNSMLANEAGRKVELSNAVRSIEYFEDILTPSVSMKIEVISSINIVSELMITGGEMVAMDIQTGSGRFQFGELDANGDISPGQNELYVYCTPGDWPVEVSWYIEDEANNIVSSGFADESDLICVPDGNYKAVGRII